MERAKQWVIDGLVAATMQSSAEIERRITVPPKPELGDYSFPVFDLAKAQSAQAGVLAFQIAKKVPLGDRFTKIVTAGPYLNFFVNAPALARETFARMGQDPGAFGKKPSRGSTVVVEYSSPNTNKPLHLGHLKNNALGMSVCRILEADGNRVIKTQIINDRGIHICKSMLAYQRFGKGETPESAHTKPDAFVGKWYVKYAQESEKDPALEKQLSAMLVAWEKGDPEVRGLWKKMNAWAIAGLERTYARYGSAFDKNYLESDIYLDAGPIIERGKKAGVFVADEKGNIVANLEPHGLPKKAVLRADGTSVYATQDLILAEKRFGEYRFDRSIYVVGSEQNLYFEQLFKIFELLNQPFADRCEHVSHGLVFLPEGKLKSREGKVVDADDFLDEMKALTRKEIESRWPELLETETDARAEVIALSAIKFFLLRTEAGKDVKFDPAQSLSFEGETGPYLLYAYARAKSILAKAGFASGEAVETKVLLHAAEHELIVHIDRFSSAVSDSAAKRSPHVVCHYLLRLAERFNSFYHQCPVIHSENSSELTNARLALVAASAQTLKNGLGLLNIQVLEKM